MREKQEERERGGREDEGRKRGKKEEKDNEGEGKKEVREKRERKKKRIRVNKGDQSHNCHSKPYKYPNCKVFHSVLVHSHSQVRQERSTSREASYLMQICLAS